MKNTQNPPKKWQALSTRQQKIAVALAKGKLSRPGIAERFGISVKTVDAHRRNILIALDLDGNVALARYTMRYGLA